MCIYVYIYIYTHMYYIYIYTRLYIYICLYIAIRMLCWGNFVGRRAALQTPRRGVFVSAASRLCRVRAAAPAWCL